MTPTRRGFPVVVTAPSGTGKTTVCRGLVARDPQIEFSISHTTRQRRDGERDGVDYHFVEDADFERMVGEGAFLEWAVYNEHRYGTTWAAIDAPLERGLDVLLEIEVQGARQVREKRRDALFVLLLPPSLGALAERLEGRGSDSPEAIARRLDLARGELAEGRSFDYALVNERVETCVDRLIEVLDAERRGEGAELRRQHRAEPAIERLLA